VYIARADKEKTGVTGTESALKIYEYSHVFSIDKINRSMESPREIGKRLHIRRCPRFKAI